MSSPSACSGACWHTLKRTVAALSKRRELRPVMPTELPSIGVATEIRLRVNALLRKLEVRYGLVAGSLGSLEPVSKSEAKAAGLKLFFTGVPCDKGHLAARRTSTGKCAACDRSRVMTEAQRAKKNKRDAARRAANFEHFKEVQASWQTRVRDHRLAAKKKWRQDNPGLVAAQRAARRAAVGQQCPPWADRSALLDIYRNCPKGHAVDHIVPLRGKLVSGLHVPWNLQYLTPAENRSKGNAHA